MVLRVHYFNPTDQAVAVQVEVRGVGYRDTVVTRAEPYVTYNANISIPPQSSDTETQACDVPAGANFFAMTTFSHKQSVHTYIKDDQAVVFEAVNWLDPGRRDFPAPFISFSSGKLTYQCDYVNPTNRTITSGNSYATDEACIALAWFFPATKARTCINSTLLPVGIEPRRVED
jgi:hypothetical protein